jgi:hypothetical protein
MTDDWVRSYFTPAVREIVAEFERRLGPTRMAREMNERDIDPRSGGGQWTPSLAAYYLRHADESGVSLEPEV